MFSTPQFNQVQRTYFTEQCKKMGVEVKPFGTPENARFFKNWKFLHSIPDMPHTESIVRHAFDMKMPFNFQADDYVHVGAIMSRVAKATSSLS
eukprot:COSAG05_NODE_2105_length_3552_cov_3.767738_3_plen_93_part_00